MRPGNTELIEKISSNLLLFNQSVHRIPGIRSVAARSCLARQIVDSIRRIKYITTLRDKQISESITNPMLNSFNPIKAAIWHKNNGNINEAFWLIFLSTHFGKHKSTGWELTRNVYGQLNDGENKWTWDAVINDPDGFEGWIAENTESLKEVGKFSNHRKYESVGKSGNVVSSYIEWIGNDFDHRQKIESLIDEDNNNPTKLFHTLYQSMDAVFRFGRTAKFDYLCMIGKIGLAEISPGFTYMSGATGPIVGARLLFRNDNVTPKQLESVLYELNEYLELYFGMQVLEDALCNWQKSPSKYMYFGG